MGLIKGTRGLPKFTAHCGFWRHPKWKGAGLDEMGLFVACLSYCYEHETDGRLPGPELEDLAVALGVRMREAKPALAGLLARGSLAADDDGFEIVNFAESNPTRVEIAEVRERRSEAGRKAAEARWRRAQDDAERIAIRMPDASETHSDSHANANARAEQSRAEQKRDRGSGASAAPDPKVATLVAGYVDDYRAVCQGHDPPQRFRAAAGAAVKRALADHEAPDDIAVCLGVIAREGKNPNVLPNVLSDFHAGRPRRGR